ncbi:MAG: hypothetical protein QOE82_88 [Thermoanaerobaculia bacterium]|jgi:hypothetical protein|nr:hypothetical protein [Thermoanaerobaculia bacterium]
MPLNREPFGDDNPMTAKATYLFSLGLFALLGCGVWATLWANDALGETGGHGPAALVVTIPFLIVFVIGALILAVLVFRANLTILPTLVGYLPLGLLVLAAFGMLLLTMSR